ncbi:S-layer homology domain-containing protein [Sporosarcina sp. Sa2YVA2]|uniref:S-layer homology domain-containing protein n=1 Tax=Sporosarcina quadrami TaxID=2762234 RepID=A0ABR8UA66_9BACL|nr:S-layer homology domain-containing protein [Sporosarcina quadrami]MBD7984598.1 S-layer homology domain-containing protein [Sporosarcina quadrami]
MKKHILTTALAATLLITTTTAQAKSFIDVPTTHWAHAPIDTISNAGLINGYDDGTYRLNHPVTRAQSAKIVALAINAKPTDDYKLAFKDVTQAHGSYNHIKALTQRGVFPNTETFNPNAPLKREDMAKMIAVAYNIILDDNDLISFKDVNKSNANYKYITAIAELNITTTKQGGEFLPTEPVTRAQMAAFVTRAMEFDAKRKTGEIYYDKTKKQYVEKIYTIPEAPPVAMEEPYALQSINLVNKERQQHKLTQLTHDKALTAIAQKKAEDMAKNNYFAHQSPTYGSVGQMLDRYKYDWTAYGENIAKGYTTSASVVDGWMNSPGHRANVLQSKFTNIGSGYATDKDGTTYWVHMFSKK